MPNPKLETYKNKATNTVYDLTDAAAQSALTGILDGTTIDSFGDVETALSGKISTSETTGLVKNDGTIDTTSYLSSVPLANANAVGGIKVGGQYDNYFSMDISGRLEPVFHNITPSSEGAGFAASSGVYDAIQDVYEVNAKTGVHNIFPIKLSDVKSVNTSGSWSGDVYSMNGVAFSFVEDGGYVTSVTASRFEASSSTASIYLSRNMVFKKDVEYILNGCPNLNDDQIWLGVYGSQYEYNSKNGNDSVVISYDADTTRDIRIRVGSSSNPSNAVFKPMIRYASDTDATYQPYVMTNGELMEKVQGIIDAANNAADFAAFKTAIGNL